MPSVTLWPWRRQVTGDPQTGVKVSVLVVIALILITIMSFMVAKKCVRHYKKQVHSIGVLLEGKCDHQFMMKHEIMKECCDEKEMKCDGKEMKCDGKEMKCDGKEKKCEGMKKEDAGKVVVAKKIEGEKKVEKKAVK